MQISSRKILVILAGLLLAGFAVYQSSAFIHRVNFSGGKLLRAVAGANLYLLLLSVVVIYGCYAVRALRWQLFQDNLGASRFWVIYKMTLAGFAAIFILGRAGEPVRPLLLARKEKLPVADLFGIYTLERLFDFACTAVIASLALLFFRSQGAGGETATGLETAAKSTGVLLSAGVAGAAAFLAYLRLRGTAALERRLQGWREAGGGRGAVARTLLGFARGVQAIRDWRELLLAILYSAVHWLLVLVMFYWVTRSFGGQLGQLRLGDVMLVMALSLVGSVVQLPAVGGGAQVASALVYTKMFGVETEPATAAAIMIWLIGFAACCLAGVPLLIQEGMSPRKLRKLAEREKEAGGAAGAQQGESAP
jgi:uncharacterized protein (TIRG00374 family)